MKIESYEHACEILKRDPVKSLPDVSGVIEKHQKAQIAIHKIIYIIEASREGKDPDWNDMNERKWYPWWNLDVSKNNPSGFRFSVSIYVLSFTDSHGGSRLVYRSEAESDWHSKKHIELYRDLNVIPK